MRCGIAHDEGSSRDDEDDTSNASVALVAHGDEPVGFRSIARQEGGDGRGAGSSTTVRLGGARVGYLLSCAQRHHSAHRANLEPDLKPWAKVRAKQLTALDLLDLVHQIETQWPEYRRNFVAFVAIQGGRITWWAYPAARAWCTGRVSPREKDVRDALRKSVFVCNNTNGRTGPIHARRAGEVRHQHHASRHAVCDECVRQASVPRRHLRCPRIFLQQVAAWAAATLGQQQQQASLAGGRRRQGITRVRSVQEEGDDGEGALGLDVDGRANRRGSCAEQQQGDEEEACGREQSGPASQLCGGSRRCLELERRGTGGPRGIRRRAVSVGKLEASVSKRTTAAPSSSVVSSLKTIATAAAASLIPLSSPFGPKQEGKDRNDAGPETTILYDDILFPVLNHPFDLLVNYPWPMKSHQAMMRAGIYPAMDANCSRVRLYKLGQRRAGRGKLDVGIYKNRHWSVRVPLVPPIPMEDHSRWRYLISADGQGASWRLAKLLSINSVVLKARSDSIEYYYRSLEEVRERPGPWNHAAHLGVLS